MKMRKGFTLVELLIVIVIIGILAAAMLLSSGSASDAAKAASAVSEMRALKAAIIMYASNIGNNETQLAAFDGTTNDKDLVHVVSLDMEKPSKIILNFTAKYHPNTGSGAKKGRVEIATRAGGDYVSEGVQERLRKNTALDNDGTADDGKMIFPLARVN